jgi:hypothetical protein
MLGVLPSDIERGAASCPLLMWQTAPTLRHRMCHRVDTGFDRAAAAKGQKRTSSRPFNQGGVERDGLRRRHPTYATATYITPAYVNSATSLIPIFVCTFTSGAITRRRSQAHDPIIQAMLRAYPGSSASYNYGPICVAESHRGRGLAIAMFARLAAASFSTACRR